MLHEYGSVLRQAAEARIEIDSARLVVLNAASKIDKGDAKLALQEIAEAKVLVPRVLTRILDDVIQVYGAEGISQDTPLAYMWACARTMRMVDGPDEVHLLQLGKRESRRAGTIRNLLGRQNVLERELFSHYKLSKTDNLFMGWTQETKPRAKSDEKL